MSPGDITPEPCGPQRAHAEPRPVPSLLVDEGGPPPRRIQWMTTAVAFQTAAFTAIGAGGGYLVGRVLSDLLPRTGPLFPLLGTLLGAALLGLDAVRIARRRRGHGRRVADVPLPAPQPARAPLPVRGETRVTTQPGAVLRAVSRVRVHRGKVRSLAVSADGRLAVSAGADRRVAVWDVETGFELHSFHEFEKWAGPAAFSPEGRLVAAAGVHDWGNRHRPATVSVRVWDAGTGQELRRIEGTTRVLSLAFLPDGKGLVLGLLDAVQLWQLDTPRLDAMVGVSAGLLGVEEVRAVSVSADGRLVLAGCHASQQMRLLNLERAEEVRTFPGHGSAFSWFRSGAVAGTAFSPDGMRALSGSWDQTARVWNLLTGEELCRFEGHRGTFGWRGVTGVAWAAGGQHALSASEDGTLRLWDAATGEELTRYDHGARILCLAATPDGRTVLTGGGDGAVRVWRL